MYIEPNTTIKLLKNCPLDTTYDHTIYFSNKTAQSNYFSSIAKYTLSGQTYQRVNKNSMRVQYKADDLYDCNYLMFQNTNYGNKWFYAFIKSVEYVNNITSEITYEIDVMQTWAFDYTLEQCFIEREHSATDIAGENTVPENLETGDIIEDGSTLQSTEIYSEGRSIVICATNDNGESIFADSGLYAGIFQGGAFKVFPANDEGTTAAINFLNTLTVNVFQNVICVFMCPTKMTQPLMSYGAKSQGIVSIEKPTTIGNYTPKNKKLLTYPYTGLYVSNLQGQTNTFKYELFSDTTAQFSVYSVFTENPELFIFPNAYSGSTNVNMDCRMSIGNFPQCSFPNNGFLSKVGNFGLQLGMGCIADAVAANVMEQKYPKAQTQKTTKAEARQLADKVASKVIGATSLFEPNAVYGNTNNGSLFSLGMQDFMFVNKHIKEEFAKIIDDYFSMFGYATNRVKTPNISSRPHWNYIKTAGCVVVGSIPCDDINKICNIFDSGITFWKNANEIGNYSLDNSP